MSTPWQPPAGNQPPPPPQFGAYAAPQLPPPAWTPPPKPGLIPLRPLSLGTILGASFQVMRRNPRPTFGIALLLNAVVLTTFVIVIGGFLALAVTRVQSAAEAEQGSIIAGSVLGGALTLLVPFAGSVVLSAILQGLISLEVARGTVGEKLRTRGLLRFARGRIGPLIGWAFAVVGVVVISFAVVAGVVTLLIAFGDTIGTVIGIILAIGFLLVFAVAAVWLGTKLSLVPSALLIEQVSLRRAIARSWSLTNRSFWKTLGIEWLVAVIISVATQVITTPISFVLGIVMGILAPTGDPSTAITVIVVAYIVIGIVSLVVGAISSVMQCSTATLIYLDLRMRREGLDLELARFVEARQAGDTTVADPYLTVTQPAPVPWG